MSSEYIASGIVGSSTRSPAISRVPEIAQFLSQRLARASQQIPAQRRALLFALTLPDKEDESNRNQHENQNNQSRDERDEHVLRTRLAAHRGLDIEMRRVPDSGHANIEGV